jgi:hypothetical protein
VASLNCSSEIVYRVTISEVYCYAFREDAMSEYSDIKLRVSKFSCHIEMSDICAIDFCGL